VTTPRDNVYESMPPGPRWTPGYVHRGQKAVERHVCDLPAEWPRGALWRCQDGHLWVCEGTFLRRWEPATWWARLSHGGKRARDGMAIRNRQESQAHLRARLAPPPASSTPSNPDLEAE
jgi:hypothetical protein